MPHHLRIQQVTDHAATPLRCCRTRNAVALIPRADHRLRHSSRRPSAALIMWLRGVNHVVGAPGSPGGW